MSTTYHYGRLVDHVHLRVADLDASKRFYRTVVAALGRPDTMVEGPTHFHIDELYVDLADGPVSHVHLAFQARDRAMVEAFHRAALGAGGRDHGAPGERVPPGLLRRLRARPRRQQPRGRLPRAGDSLGRFGRRHARLRTT